EAIVVEGPAGIGKTSVLAEARARAAESGMHVLAARASELEQTFSYGVVRQLLEPLLTRSDDAARARLLEGAALHAASLFAPEQLHRAAASEDEAFAIVHGLYWLVLNLAEVRPLALAIDDLHWVDAASLRVLSYLSRRLETAPVCVLVTVRVGEDEDPVLSELLADQATVIARPAPLTASAVAELVRAGLGAHAEEQFCLAVPRARGQAAGIGYSFTSSCGRWRRRTFRRPSARSMRSSGLPRMRLPARSRYGFRVCPPRRAWLRARSPSWATGPTGTTWR